MAEKRTINTQELGGTNESILNGDQNDTSPAPAESLQELPEPPTRDVRVDKISDNVNKKALSLSDRIKLNGSYIALYNKELYEYATGLPSESTSRMRNPLKRSRMSLNGTYTVKKTGYEERKRRRALKLRQVEGRFDLGTNLAEDEDSDVNSEDDEDEEQEDDEEDIDIEEDIDLNNDTEVIEEDYLMDGFVAGSYWLAQEKEMFFNYLGRTTRHNLAEIARRIVTKSLVEIEEYHDLLFNATQYYKDKFSEYNQLPKKLPYTFGSGPNTSGNEKNNFYIEHNYEMNPQHDGRIIAKKYIVGMDEMPCAREMSEHWINMEERQSGTVKDYASYFAPSVTITPFKDTIYQDLERDALKSLLTSRNKANRVKEEALSFDPSTIVDEDISDPSSEFRNENQDAQLNKEPAISTEEQPKTPVTDNLLNIQELARLSERFFYNAPYDRDPKTFEFRSRTIDVQRFEVDLLQELEQIIRAHTRKILSQIYFNELNASYKGDGTTFTSHRLIARRDIYRVLAQLNLPSNLKQGFWRKWADRSNVEVVYHIKKPTWKPRKYGRQTKSGKFKEVKEYYVPTQRRLPDNYRKFLSHIPEYNRGTRARYGNHLETSHNDPKFCDPSRDKEYLKALRGPDAEFEVLIDSEEEENNYNEQNAVKIEGTEETAEETEETDIYNYDESDEDESEFSDDYPEDFEDMLDDDMDHSDQEDIVDFLALDKVSDEELYYLAEEAQLNKIDLAVSQKEEFVLLNYINTFESHEPLDNEELAHLRIYEKSCEAYSQKPETAKDYAPLTSNFPPPLTGKELKQLYSTSTEGTLEEISERETGDLNYGEYTENSPDSDSLISAVDSKKLALFLKSIPPSGFTTSEGN